MIVERNSPIARAIRDAYAIALLLTRILFRCTVWLAIIIAVLLHAALGNRAGKD